MRSVQPIDAVRRIAATVLLALALGACGSEKVESCVDKRISLQHEKDAYKDELIITGVPSEAAQILADRKYDIDAETRACLA